MFIAVILWVTIMGRRDLILTRNIEVKFRVAEAHQVVGQTTDEIRLRLSGPRAALKELMDGNKSKPVMIDIAGRGEGVFDIDVPVNRIDIPAGVKILSVRPNLIRVEVEKSP